MVSDDRGQLILVGAVAIALVLLGLVLIVNTALFTQVVGSEGTVDATEDGAMSSHEIGNALAAVVASANRNESLPSAAGIDEQVTKQNRTVESAMLNRTLEHSGAIVSVEYLDHEHVGTRIAQENVADFTNASTNADSWMPINTTEQGEIGRFVVTIDTANSATGNLSITVDGSKIVLAVNRPSSGSVTVDVDGGATCTVEATNGSVRVDLYNGYVAGNVNCQFDLIHSQSAPHSIEFGEDLEDVRGTYAIVANASSVNRDRFGSKISVTEAVWSFDYSFSHRTNAATVESDNRQVEVYD